MLSKLRHSIYLVALIFAYSVEVCADTTTDQIIETTLEPTADFDISKNISGGIGFGYESNFYEQKAADKKHNLYLLLELAYKHNDWNYGLNALVSNELIKDEKTELGDTKIFALKSLDWFDPQSSLSSSLSLNLTLPSSDLSRYDKRMLVNFSGGPTISWKKDNFNIFLIPRLGKNFNKYKTTYIGEANTSYYTKWSVAPTYQFTDKLRTQFTTSVTQSWTENHSRKSPTYSTELSTELKVAKNLSLALGIGNEDKIYKSNGTSSNVKIFDRNLSIYSLIITKDF